MEQYGLTNKADTVIDTSAMLDLLDIEVDLVNTLTDTLPVYLWVHDEDHTVVYGNRNFMMSFGNCIKQSCHKCIMGKDEPCGCCQSGKTLARNKPTNCKLCKRNGFGYDRNIFHTPIINRYGERFILNSSFHFDNVEILDDNYFPEISEKNSEKFFLVMCSSCNKIKDKKNNWISIDNYILDYFNVSISHGICPTCIERLYPDLHITINNEDQAV